MSATATMPELFPKLFSPLRIGKTTIKNRIVSSGHDTGMSVAGNVSDQLVAYHRARAVGGTGLIVMQVSGVHETAQYTTHMLMATDDSAIAGFRRIAEAVHPYDCKVFAQIFHPGREIMESLDGSRPVTYSASNAFNDRFHSVPAVMPTALIKEVIEGFADSAERMLKGGLDGAEIVASHGYLPAQFLNPRLNDRTDEYGGSAENRLRFLREVIVAVRERVGDDFVVGLRISGDEMSEDGLVLDETVQVCSALNDDGHLDYISVVAGTSATLGGSVHIVPPMTQTTGYTAPIAGKIKDVVDIPVMVAGRINQPQDAELILANGQADACAMTRALICDPEMPNKAELGQVDDIRACIGCNQACIGHHHAGYPISCIQRPETGRELVYDLPNPVVRRKSVMVIGGGPAGLKAATVAAQRGHAVTLYEAGRRVGGQVLLAERLPGRAEFGGAITNLIAESQRSGVQIVTGTQVDTALIRDKAPDTVILATGSTPRAPSIEIADDPVVLEARDVVNGADVPSGRIVIADWRCDWIGLGVARMLAERGRKVTLCVDGYMAGEMLQQYVRDEMLSAAHEAGVEVIPNVSVMGIDEDTVYLQHRLSGQPVMVDDVAATVFSLGPIPNNGLQAQIADLGIDVTAIGDCLAPRTVEEAVLEGLKAAWKI
ncbi:FAD-binding protein (plasmid) [Rhodococcus rhodochrous]|uniref:oxidoreductase n=1 Tax=Rhodococcus rhodochrous TaxID=1829 RepID=UPI00132F460F|nr:FAD-dependent oxidoreductase [Rhodococcus rhodochrous]QHG85513.1 FAD-binding protein [Rhodococcus rhodochrous]